MRALLCCAQELPKWTPEEVAAVFASLAEWEETLKEIRTQADAMRENCINFQVRMWALVRCSRILPAAGARGWAHDVVRGRCA